VEGGSTRMAVLSGGLRGSFAGLTGAGGRSAQVQRVVAVASSGQDHAAKHWHSTPTRRQAPCLAAWDMCGPRGRCGGADWSDARRPGRGGLLLELLLAPGAAAGCWSVSLSWALQCDRDPNLLSGASTRGSASARPAESTAEQALERLVM
jgi:hypothetical protein